MPSQLVQGPCGRFACGGPTAGRGRSAMAVPLRCPRHRRAGPRRPWRRGTGGPRTPSTQRLAPARSGSVPRTAAAVRPVTAVDGERLDPLHRGRPAFDPEADAVLDGQHVQRVERPDGPAGRLGAEHPLERRARLPQGVGQHGLLQAVQVEDRRVQGADPIPLADVAVRIGPGDRRDEQRPERLRCDRRRSRRRLGGDLRTVVLGVGHLDVHLGRVRELDPGQVGHELDDDRRRVGRRRQSLGNGTGPRPDGTGGRGRGRPNAQEDCHRRSGTDPHAAPRVDMIGPNAP